MPPFLILGPIRINDRTGEHHAGDVGRLRRVAHCGFLVEDSYLRRARSRSAVLFGPCQAEKSGVAQAALPVVKQRSICITAWHDIRRRAPSRRQVRVEECAHASAKCLLFDAVVQVHQSVVSYKVKGCSGCLNSRFYDLIAHKQLQVRGSAKYPD